MNAESASVGTRSATPVPLRATVSTVWRLLSRDERRSAIRLGLLAGIGAVLETISVGAVIPLMAALSSGAGLEEWSRRLGLQGWADPSQLPLLLGGAFVAMYVAKTAYMVWLTRHQGAFVCRLESRVSRALFERYLGSPWIFHLQRNSADLIQTVLKETFVLAQAAYASVNLLIDMCVVIALVLLLATIEPAVTFAAVMPLGLIAFIFQRAVRGRTAIWGAERLRLETVRLRHLQQGLASVRELLLTGRARYFAHAYDDPTERYASVSTSYNTIIHLPRLVLELTAILLIGTITIVLVVSGRSFSEVLPSLALFGAGALRVLPSLTRILGSLQIIRWGSSSVAHIQKELVGTLDVASAGIADRACVFSGDLLLEGVEFRYPVAPRPALAGVSLLIRRGSLVGLIGPSGSGKSTLMDIILGLLLPTAGTVKVGGVDVQSSLRAWQNDLGYVPQSINLTDDTFRRNVAFGIPDSEIDDQRVWRALEDARLREFVESLPLQLDTTLGERGARLSGGQRQRIGIARALYQDPSVLVLDEATSALDIATEAEIMETVLAFRGRKTVIIVAHRLSTVRPCDEIHRLEGGKVVASGRFGEVVGAEAS